MLRHKNLLALFGMAAIIAGLFVFGAGREFSTNWARWVFGPLLWFIGFAMMVAWVMQVVSNTARKQDEESAKTMKRRATDDPRR